MEGAESVVSSEALDVTERRRTKREVPVTYDVLIVEDEAVIRSELAEALEADGLTVMVAPNGRAALDALNQNRARIIILDLIMPVMSGREFVEALVRERGASAPPVLFITAVSNIEHAPPGAVFLKPINVESLLRAVKLHLASH